MEFIDVLDNVPKDRFKSVANKLLNECFLLKKDKDTSQDYSFVLNYREKFITFFDILGIEVIIREDQGVIGINNPSGTGRIHLKKHESILLLILRLIYIEEKRKISASTDVITIIDNVYDKINMLNMKNKIDKTQMKNSMSMFKRYHIIRNLDADMTSPETRIQINPSVLLAVANESLDEMYEIAKEKLDKYIRGGEMDDNTDETDNEEND